MKNATELLKNLVPTGGYLKATLKAGIAMFKPFSGDLYTVHIRIDYRNPVESLFIRKKNDDREVFGVGGSGGSSQRQMNTFFTAVLYMLSKKTRILRYLFKYDGFNRLKYIGCKYRTILTPGFGSNFDLDKRLYMEIQEKGL